MGIFSIWAIWESFVFLPFLFSYCMSLEKNRYPSFFLASLIAVFDWSANIPYFFCFLPSCQNQKNMNSEYKVLGTFPHSSTNVVIWIKKKYIYPSFMFAFKASNIIFGLLCFALPSSIPIMLAFVERPSQSFCWAPRLQYSSLMTVHGCNKFVYDKNCATDFDSW